MRQIASTGAHTLSILTAATTETGPGAVLSLLSEYRRSVKEGSMTRAELDKLSDILPDPSPDPHSESTSVMVSPPSSQTAPIIHMEPSVPSYSSARCTARPANPLEVCIDYSPRFPRNLTLRVGQVSTRGVCRVDGHSYRFKLRTGIYPPSPLAFHGALADVLVV